MAMRKKKTWPGVDPSGWEHATRMLADKQRDRLSFSSEKISKAPNVYVAWIDVMGAGNAMATSMHKTANAIARLHLAVHYAATDHKISGHTLAINDGLFLISPSKQEIMTILRTAWVMLVSNFIARPNHPDRFLIRGAVAYGPVYRGSDMIDQLEARHLKSGADKALTQIAFGPPIIEAYQSEKAAPPFGVAVHESARAFSPAHEETFRTPLWLWWQTNDNGKIPAPTPQSIVPLKNLFASELMEYLDYLEATSSFHSLSVDKIKEMKIRSQEYYIGYSSTQRQNSKKSGKNQLS